MSQIKDFVLSLISASAVTMIFESVIPDGGLKKYLKYVFALFILIVLLSPLKELVGKIGNLTEMPAYSYDISDASHLANGIIAGHIKRAIAEKFSVSESDASVTVGDAKWVIKIKRKSGLLAEDIIYYTANSFGISPEVIFYE